MTCSTCGRTKGERRPRCIRCAESPRDRQLPTPLPGRYLVVDPGARAGWAIVEGARLIDHGECGAFTVELASAVNRAVDSFACEAMVIESPGLGRSLPAASVYGLGRAAGAWWWHWLTRSTRGKVVEVAAMTWRSTVLGGPQRSKAEWIAAARAHVRAKHGIESGPDECMAICLAEHAVRSLAVADAVGVRRLHALGWTEPRGAWVNGRFVAAEGGR